MKYFKNLDLEIIKILIRYPLNLIGLQIINIDDYKENQKKITKLIKTINDFYLQSLMNKNNLTDSEYLQFLELYYGGYINEVSTKSARKRAFGVKGTKLTGGDRMSVLFHNYSDNYAEYLKPLRYSKNTIKVLEVGILKGTGLAIWDDYFENKKIYGFDYELENIQQNMNNLIKLGAFRKELPTLKFFDQFADNSETLKVTFGVDKIDVVIDDGYHSDESIINTFNELQPYLNANFVYFIEDNANAWKQLSVMFPDYNFDYKDNNLCVVSNK